jgi:hypothetical protein
LDKRIVVTFFNFLFSYYIAPSKFLPETVHIIFLGCSYSVVLTSIGVLMSTMTWRIFIVWNCKSIYCCTLEHQIWMIVMISIGLWLFLGLLSVWLYWRFWRYGRIEIAACVERKFWGGFFVSSILQKFWDLLSCRTLSCKHLKSLNLPNYSWVSHISLVFRFFGLKLVYFCLFSVASRVWSYCEVLIVTLLWNWATISNDFRKSSTLHARLSSILLSVKIFVS